MFFGTSTIAQDLSWGVQMAYGNLTSRTTILNSDWVIVNKRSVSDFSAGFKFEHVLSGKLFVLTEFNFGKSFTNLVYSDTVNLSWTDLNQGTVEQLGSIYKENKSQQLFKVEPRILVQYKISDKFSIQAGLNYCLLYNLSLPNYEIEVDRSNIDQSIYSPTSSNINYEQNRINSFLMNQPNYDFMGNQFGLISPIFGLTYQLNNFDISMRMLNRITQLNICYNIGRYLYQ
jgi:hypothetical protein